MKKIILAFDGTHFSEGAFEFARQLNEINPVLITGVFLPQAEIANLWSYADGAGGPYIPIIESNETDIVQKNVAHFKKLCEGNGIDYRVHEDFFDFVLPELKKETSYADLLILGSEMFYKNMGTDSPNDYLRDALQDLKCPVLLVPEMFEFPENIILTYDGSEDSIYAIKQFAYVLNELTKKETTLVYVSEGTKDDFPNKIQMEELVARHFSNLTLLKLDISPNNFFKDWLIKRKSSLVVSGSYGRSGLSQIFNWYNIRQQLIYGVADVQKMESAIENLNLQNQKISNDLTTINAELKSANDIVSRNDGEIERLKLNNQDKESNVSTLQQLLASSKNENQNLQSNLNKSEGKILLLEQKLNATESELLELKRENTQLKTEEKNKREKYDQDITSLNAIREQIQNDRNKEVEDRNKTELERRNRLKETWSKHQISVKGFIKNICQKHTIQYLETVPFKGEPDNTIFICEEYVIFDAKSPAADDLNNFPLYIKTQAEAAKKYPKIDNVKADIFFVIPTNTLEKISQFVFNLADYNVYVISYDALEQMILSLKKIEEYEFAEQLSPEERDNICRVLGKFAHLTKRRIQIDSFFAKQFIELAYKSESDLPKDIFDKVLEFERSEKLNPPQEKRAKAISTKELEKELIKLNNEVFSKGILIDDTKISNGINELELYKSD